MTRPAGSGKRLRQEPAIQVSVWIPGQLSERLDKLCRLLNEDGDVGRVHRKELAAALFFAAPETLDELETLISNYRKARPEDASVGKEKGALVYEFRRAKPGPRTS